ncbi:uncharacterized protein LOC113341085 [Papaver somniferum]|uniref:uncharacterized protein LOC113341085 n=1 Tax=Papaver somniferum TaxID=3469 RepID=UPI000E6F9A46|nr:uncharacterized protein LOC113341085 [Papaver somniferum]
MKLVTEPDDTRGLILVLNPNRGESLVLSYLLPTGGYICMCHGFGFDLVSQVYKVVIVFTSKANRKYLCMVITLGTIKWRTLVTSYFDISPPPGFSPFHSRMITRTSSTLCRQSTLCGGDLFWRTKNKVSDSNYSEMLLSFDLHNKKIHFIRLPADCTPITPTDERQYLADDHLLEFKGYPCVARSERVTRSNNDHCGHRCNYQSGICCCCYKVHIYILTDKDKQVWTREETFDVQIMDQESSLPTPLCCYFDTSAATPPTRILTSSDQVLLYWFNGERLILYNLQEKHLKVVECSLSYSSVFQTKMNEDLERRIGDGDNIFCPSMDYQLRSQVENIVSLKTLIPKEAKISESDCADVIHPLDNSLATGWLTTGRTGPVRYR